MSQLSQVQAWLSHFTYKPGVVITARNGDDSLRLDVRVPIIDWRDGNTRRRLLCTYAMPENIVSARQFFRWLDEAVLPVFDRHEHNEYFRVDGIAIFDPHTESPPGLRSLDENRLQEEVRP